VARYSSRVLFAARVLPGLIFFGSLGACGARSELIAPALADAASDRVEDVVDAVDADPPRDVGIDAPPACTDLVTGVPPTVALTASQGGFATPRVVGRNGAFDIVGPLSNASPGIRARSARIASAGTSFEFDALQIVGEDSWTWAESGTDGNDLALCYESNGATLRTWHGGYESALRVSIVFPPGVGTCRGIAWAGDRWISGWHDYNGPSYIVEHARDGTMLSAPRVAMVSLGTTTPSLTGYGHGAAWVTFDGASQSFVVVYARPGMPDVRHDYAVLAAVASLRLAAWPDDPGAIAITWLDATSLVHLLVVRDDGTTVLADRALFALPVTGDTRSVEIAPFLDGVALATFVCDDNGVGSIGVHRVDRTASVRGAGVNLPLDCRRAGTLAALAANERDNVGAWLTPRGPRMLDFDISAASFRCRD
jgi:hypothetical protein